MLMFTTGLVVGVLVSALWSNRSVLGPLLSNFIESVSTDISIAWHLWKEKRLKARRQWDPMDEPMEMNYDPRQDRKDI